MRCLVYLSILPYGFSLYSKSTTLLRAMILRLGLSRRGLSRHFRRLFGNAQHLRRYRGLRRGWAGGRLAVRALLAMFFALFEPLERLVDAHGQELDHRICNAQAALELLDGLRRGRELDQDVGAFAMLIDAVGEPAPAPLIH